MMRKSQKKTAIETWQRIALKTLSGISKPGAKIPQIDYSNPPPDSCWVLILGAKDIAASDNCTILELLKKHFTARLSSAHVVISTVPHRNDLSPDHQVNQRTALSNSFIEYLCIRHEEIELLDCLNTIRRRWFTRQGMHLRMPDERILAELLVIVL
ncbi:hypothetical protein J6590_026034 [Homalodisca vitripennis]|nr:hypothetical protein J6590_026034 [Homalodisca vitripennis]